MDQKRTSMRISCHWPTWMKDLSKADRKQKIYFIVEVTGFKVVDTFIESISKSSPLDGLTTKSTILFESPSDEDNLSAEAELNAFIFIHFNKKKPGRVTTIFEALYPTIEAQSSTKAENSKVYSISETGWALKKNQVEQITLKPGIKVQNLFQDAMKRISAFESALNLIKLEFEDKQAKKVQEGGRKKQMLTATQEFKDNNVNPEISEGFKAEDTIRGFNEVLQRAAIYNQEQTATQVDLEVLEQKKTKMSDLVTSVEEPSARQDLFQNNYCQVISLSLSRIDFSPVHHSNLISNRSLPSSSANETQSLKHTISMKNGVISLEEKVKQFLQNKDEKAKDQMIIELTPELSAKDTRINTLEENINRLDGTKTNQVSEHDMELERYRETIQQQQEETKAQNLKIAELEKINKNQAELLSSRDAEINQLKTEHNSFKSKLKDLEESYEEQRKKVEEAEKKINNLRAQVAGKNDEIILLNTQERLYNISIDKMHQYFYEIGQLKTDKNNLLQQSRRPSVPAPKSSSFAAIKFPTKANDTKADEERKDVEASCLPLLKRPVLDASSLISEIQVTPNVLKAYLHVKYGNIKDIFIFNPSFYTKAQTISVQTKDFTLPDLAMNENIYTQLAEASYIILPFYQESTSWKLMIISNSEALPIKGRKSKQKLKYFFFESAGKRLTDDECVGLARPIDRALCAMGKLVDPAFTTSFTDTISVVVEEMPIYQSSVNSAMFVVQNIESFLENKNVLLGRRKFENIYDSNWCERCKRYEMLLYLLKSEKYSFKI